MWHMFDRLEGGATGGYGAKGRLRKEGASKMVGRVFDGVGVDGGWPVL